ncbi:Domain of unknown function (DUF374) [Seminavis robusta]|uniref:DUF374 domain-containing protein n=1 Tax=Seminavis robusta TaxID=568900 RepID=A0A9N8DAZ0_9STRA|nr:Domain of unknown function (DUF374) [Seminavis robusta]|eukprot:Sro40_g024450.1 Domain of unknown function (DUF374) (221) ;mRNA; f:6424-7086
MGRGIGNLRVDNVPIFLSPLIKGYGIVGSACMSAMIQTIRATCHWEFVNPNHYSKACIHVTWHENIPTYMSSYTIDSSLPQKHVWLQHPSAYMAPVHALLHRYGVEYILGSSGHGGQVALNRLTETMLAHEMGSSAFFPDGPSGPAKVVKPGVVQLAQATGLPMIPIRYEFSNSWRTGWDQKHFPKPGSTIVVQEMGPMFVKPGDDNLKQGVAELQRQLE